MTVVAVLEGGLGNQMFEYAYGRALALKDNTDLILDPSILGNYRTPRTYALGVFNVVASLLQPGMKVENSQRVTGHHLSEKFFVEYEDRIRQEFTLVPEAASEFRKKSGFSFLKEVNACESVSIQIRRGDFVTDPVANDFHGTCSPEYYYNAVDYIASKIENPVLFIFSDDIKWAKQNLHLQQRHIFVSGNDLADHEELILSSFCKHHIISNSSFGWWGAWLGHNPDKIICSPRQWTRQPYNLGDLFPEGWVLL